MENKERLEKIIELKDDVDLFKTKALEIVKQLELISQTLEGKSDALSTKLDDELEAVTCLTNKVNILTPKVASLEKKLNKFNSFNEHKLEKVNSKKIIKKNRNVIMQGRHK